MLRRVAGIGFAETELMAALSGIVIVLVEDDPDALALFRTILENEGATVMPAPGSQSALDLLGRLRPDVLVSDMQMPDWDGAWLVTESRKRRLLNGVPTLLVTATTMTREQVRHAGFDAYLHKPVDPKLLWQTIYYLARPETQASA